MNFYIYTATQLANEVMNDRNREAAKERRWAQALKAKRNNKQPNR